MPRQEFDKSSKWLVEHHSRGILRLGGLTEVRSARAVQPELVQPRQLPDGLLEVSLRGRKEPVHLVLEVATYPEQRALEQAIDDLMMVFLDRRKVPELLMLVLRPKGRMRIEGTHSLRSELGLSELSCKWTVVELWKQQAEDLLALEDVGVIPWVPLTQFEGPPAELLERCRERIERQSLGDERLNLFAVSQVMASLRFPDPVLRAILGGSRAMIDSPALRELVEECEQKGRQEASRRAILLVLKVRFGAIPAELVAKVNSVTDEERLQLLTELAAKCSSLKAFRTKLSS